MTSPWLTLIGLGEDGVLAPGGQTALAEADIVFGGARHLDLAGEIKAEKRTWPSPFASVFDDLRQLSGKKVSVLATGDPMWFGIGSSLLKHFDADELTILPSQSAFQLAAARMGWALQDTECLSVHGRSVNLLRSALYPGARILLLTSNATTPSDVADLLADEGFGKTSMTVLEHLGGSKERRVSGSAEDWRQDVANFHTLALEVTAEPGTRFRARIPGLPDDAFRHDGKMTKQDVRAITLAELKPHPGALLWDVGAGCGSIAIEWLRAADRTQAIGLEPNPERRQFAAENAISLGVPHLQLIDALAPDGLEGLAQPDAIFIGGGLTAPGIVKTCLDALPAGGRLVANAVTLESEAVLLATYQALGGTLKKVSVHRASAVGGLTGWRPLMPVTQWSFTKA
ncbi:MAG: precorrin-6y C5,15-methyltransferase (decarboxylating) subunit CbiE [Roseibium sp.]|uniref:precorrin-6y C5,15-methyltransferase (decarboxylating) subunit CbiE n=1 Tax=Roseibium sp. TaxID=1936156 RepID=UPI001B20533D|nr:precorrin-6y C5,15-methyltransferase (decarboxylating) subunit CbiE [Roseibium sp.]MBO6891533.1 precorrin-6y C5,15-methyltransferase (decarboxylating) subunit CbiE [Roseibium sp.]MBO6931043.1 precorrin-6y C5,15-methyltransferase (decarboxylating) subunit CbiE [Roseibium sp.]